MCQGHFCIWVSCVLNVIFREKKLAKLFWTTNSDPGVRYPVLWSVKPFSTQWIQIKLKSFFHFFTALLLASFRLFISLNNCTKKVHVPETFNGIDNNSAKKYGEFPTWACSVYCYYVIKKYSQLTKYTKESQLLQHTSHIRKFSFVILLKFSKILMVKLKKKMVKVEDVGQLKQTEMQMVRWMCGASLSDRKPSDELKDRLGIESITDVMHQMHLRWFGHVERMDNDNWISKCRNLVVAGVSGRGRPNKTSHQVILGDMRELRIEKDLAQDCSAWRRAIKKPPSNPC